MGKEKKNTVSFAFTNFIFVPGEKKIFCNKIVFDENKIFFEERKKLKSVAVFHGQDNDTEFFFQEPQFF